MKQNQASLSFQGRVNAMLTTKRARLLFLVAFSGVNLMVLHGCSTADSVTLNYSLEDIEKAICTQLPGGVRKISSNGREYYGNYFDPYKFDGKTNGPKDKRSFKRFRAMAVVLGDRRPYDFEITIIVEARPRNTRMPAARKFDVNYGTFVSYGESPEMGDRVTRNIQVFLRDRDKNQNVIDNFKPF